MIINADLHIHSRYSSSTSNRMTIDEITKQASLKGIDLVASGDCLHRGWQKEIMTCESVDEGTFTRNGTYIVLNSEIEGLKRVHHLIFFPDFSAIEDFKLKACKKSKNLDSSARPRIKLNGEELAAIAEDVHALIGPAHTFTPWTSMYAHYNSIEECYGNLSDYISFAELGLSANSFYADKIEELHRLTFLTSSDCHSPHPVRLAREFTRFKVNDFTFKELRKAIIRLNGNKSLLNVGLPPEEGKYNESACRSCYKHYTLEEAERQNWTCNCGKKIKKGVKDLISEMATFEEPIHPNHRPPYIHLIPLAEIITKALGQRNPFTKTVSKRWGELVTNFGSEINVLLDVDINDIAMITSPAITEAILAFREKQVIVHPGGGGKYGIIEFPMEKDSLTVSLETY